MTRVKDFIKKNTMFLALIFVMILFQVLIMSANKGSLFAPTNITNLINQNSYVLILATGMLLCILTGGNIDLSVGSVVALVGAIAGKLIVVMGMNVYLSIFICLLTGVAIGAIHGYMIAYIRIPPFIVTLAGMMLWRGVALLILDGLTISPFPDNYLFMFTRYLPLNPDNNSVILATTLIVGGIICLLYLAIEIANRSKKIRKGYDVNTAISTYGKVGVICLAVLVLSYLLGENKGIPFVLIIVLIIVAVYSYFTAKTVPGRTLYAIGGNEKAAKLSGINTNRSLFMAYTNMAFLAAVAALVCVARFNSAAPSAGTNYELDAIGACFIGGASAYGGTGTVGGAVVGAIFMGVLNNGMSILGIDANWQKVVKGLVLIIAVLVDVLNKRRAKSS